MAIYRLSLDGETGNSRAFFRGTNNSLRAIFFRDSIGGKVPILISRGKAFRVLRSHYHLTWNFSVVVKGSRVGNLTLLGHYYRHPRDLLGQDLQIRSIVMGGVRVFRARTLRTLIGTHRGVLTTTPISVETFPRVVTYLYYSSRLVAM